MPRWQILGALQDPLLCPPVTGKQKCPYSNKIIFLKADRDLGLDQRPCCAYRWQKESGPQSSSTPSLQGRSILLCTPFTWRSTLLYENPLDHSMSEQFHPFHNSYVLTPKTHQAQHQNSHIARQGLRVYNSPT